MTFIDSEGTKYKAIKHKDKYHLLTIHNNYGKEYYKIEVTGKENVLIYIKNNRLKKYSMED